jgi:hypothetical protein
MMRWRNCCILWCWYLTTDHLVYNQHEKETPDNLLVLMLAIVDLAAGDLSRGVHDALRNCARYLIRWVSDHSLSLQLIEYPTYELVLHEVFPGSAIHRPRRCFATRLAEQSRVCVPYDLVVTASGWVA